MWVGVVARVVGTVLGAQHRTVHHDQMLVVAQKMSWYYAGDCTMAFMELPRKW
jgi:hypothetical protein